MGVAASRGASDVLLIAGAPPMFRVTAEEERQLAHRIRGAEQAARAAQGGAYPPDFSVLAKARTYTRGFPTFIVDMFTQYQEQGPDYIHALLTGYVPFDKLTPAQVKEFAVTKDDNFNTSFPGHKIAMAPPLVVGALRLDSRQVRPGDAFVALRGTRAHGFAHVAAAVAAGAVAVLCEAADAGEAPSLPGGCPLVPVPDLRSHLGILADRQAGMPSATLRVVGITGTNGKTTTAWLLAAALEQVAVPAAYAGTLGAGRPGAVVAGTHTTADVFSVHGQLAGFRDAGARAATIEVSSHALDQGRVDGVRFHAAAFTHLTRDHLDYHGTMEAYGAAKARLFCRPELAHAVLNVEDPFVRSVVRRLPRRPFRDFASIRSRKS